MRRGPISNALSRLALTGALCLAAFACRTTSSSETQTDASSTTVRASRESTTANASSTTARVVLSPAGRDPVTIDVEVVQTPQARQRGLMYRKQLGANAGMLFIFERSEWHSFWMHNTLLPLDMLFITPDWRVLGVVENATPLTDSPRNVPGESQYVLEVNAGFSRRHGITPGTTLRYLPAGTPDDPSQQPSKE